jgi:LysR family transcriptional regulator for bpeEF and oprC
MVNNLNLLYTFSKVVELGSFTKAASYLKQPKSRVSRAISTLEQELNVELLRRTTRKIGLTPEGDEFFQRISPLLQEISREVSKVEDQGAKLTGRISFTAPEDVGAYILAPLLQEFSALYPDINIFAHFSNEYVNMEEHNIDIAFRMGKLNDSSMIQTKVVSFKMIYAASSDYLKTYGEPSCERDLSHHKLASFLPGNKTYPVHPFKDEDINYSITTQSFQFLYKYIKKNGGIARVPEFFTVEDQQAGIIKHILKEHSTNSAPMHIVYQRTKNLPKRTRLFIDFMKTKIREKY